MAAKSTYTGEYRALRIMNTLAMMLHYGIILQDDRTCWMEAISAGSSATLPTAPESQYAYEPVTPIPESEMYSYSYTRISRSELKHHSQAKTKCARPLPIIEEFVPDLGNQKATSTSQYVDETVSDDEEPIYDDIADSTAGDDEEPIYDDIFDLTEKMEEHDTASGTQGDQSVKHKIESFKVIN